MADDTRSTLVSINPPAAVFSLWTGINAMAELFVKALATESLERVKIAPAIFGLAEVGAIGTTFVLSEGIVHSLVHC